MSDSLLRQPIVTAVINSKAMQYLIYVVYTIGCYS